MKEVKFDRIIEVYFRDFSPSLLKRILILATHYFAYNLINLLDILFKPTGKLTSSLSRWLGHPHKLFQVQAF